MQQCIRSTPEMSVNLRKPDESSVNWRVRWGNLVFSRVGKARRPGCGRCRSTAITCVCRALKQGTSSRATAAIRPFGHGIPLGGFRRLDAIHCFLAKCIVDLSSCSEDDPVTLNGHPSKTVACSASSRSGNIVAVSTTSPVLTTVQAFS